MAVRNVVRIVSSLALLPVALTLGCASTNQVPPELANARQTYERIGEGPAAVVNAGRLLEAKEALDAAERAYREHPDAPTTRDLAYIAERRAELAEAETGIILADRRKAVAERLRGVEEREPFKETKAQ